MKKLTSLLFFVFIPLCSYSQIDTTDWFPMQTGNYWEYMALTGEGPKYFSIKILGDTLMPNGKLYKSYFYKYFDSTFEDTRYFRNESVEVYEYFGFPFYCPESEYLYLDFFVPDSTIWEICRPIDDNARGISKTFFDFTYYSFLQKPNFAKQFELVYVDSVDTIWTPTEGSIPIVINKGIGIVWHFIFNDGSYYLQGAIINGVTYGVITDVNLQQAQPTEFQLHQNFPNPFNPVTTINWQAPVSGWQTIKIYNSLGEEIETLVDEYKPAGMHEVHFTANNLPSGVYFYQLRAGEFVQTKKMILMK